MRRRSRTRGRARTRKRVSLPGKDARRTGVERVGTRRARCRLRSCSRSTISIAGSRATLENGIPFVARRDRAAERTDDAIRCSLACAPSMPWMTSVYSPSCSLSSASRCAPGRRDRDDRTIEHAAPIRLVDEVLGEAAQERAGAELDDLLRTARARRAGGTSTARSLDAVRQTRRVPRGTAGAGLASTASLLPSRSRSRDSRSSRCSPAASPDATARISANRSSSSCAIGFVPSSSAPALKSIQCGFFAAISLFDDTLIVGTGKPERRSAAGREQQQRRAADDHRRRRHAVVARRFEQRQARRRAAARRSAARATPARARPSGSRRVISPRAS